MNVTLCWSPAPRQVETVELDLPEGSTAHDALAASGWLARWPELGRGGITWGVWGRKVQADSPLAAGDRLTPLRPLRVDPKAARRERFGKQGARGAGLFAKRRPGAKPGY